MTSAAAVDFDGLLLVGHGTRAAAGQAEFWHLVELVRSAEPERIVAGAFLELAEPTIAAGVAELARQGARRIRAIPLVLCAAGHAKRDIPEALAAAARPFPGLEVQRTPHLGCRDEVLELSERRFRAVLGDKAVGDEDPGDQESGEQRDGAQPHSAAGETLLILVGRGSGDAEATAEFRAFAARRAAGQPALQVEVAFLAMAEPPLDRVLEAAARGPARRIVVQPHLLFAGELLTTVGEKVAACATADPTRQWIATAHLGPDECLAAAVTHLAREKPSNLPAITRTNVGAGAL